MKRKHIVLLVILSIVFWILAILGGIYLTMWIVWGSLILTIIVIITWIGIAKLNKTKGSSVDQRLALDPTDLIEMRDNLDILLRQPDYAELVQGLEDKFTLNVGDINAEKTPVGVLIARTYYEPGIVVFMTNLHDKKRIAILFNPNEEKMMAQANLLAEHPVEPESIVEEYSTDWDGKPVKRLKKLRESRREKIIKEQEKAESESEESLQ